MVSGRIKFYHTTNSLYIIMRSSIDELSHIQYNSSKNYGELPLRSAPDGGRPEL